MSDTLSDALSSPGIDALIGAAQGFGAAAMPSRMPVPIGAVLGQGLGGTLGGLKTSNELQQGQQQTLAAKMQNMATASSLPLMLQKNQALTNMWAHPELMQQMMNGGSGLAPASSSSSPGVMSPGDYATKTNLGENSTGNPAAKNPLSSASGNGQFIDSTWLNTFKQAYPNIATGMSDPDILALKTKTTIPGVPDLQNGMTVAYARQNAPVLQAAGLPATAANLALAHRFGPDGAKTLLQAPPGAPVSSLLGADVMTANPDLKGQTAGGVVGNMTMRMGQAPVAFGTQVAGPGAPPDQSGQTAGQTPQSGQTPEQMTSSQALGLANQYEQRANDLERQQSVAKFFQGQGAPVFPLGGDPATLRAAAQSYRTLGLAGATQLAKSMKENLDARQNGLIRTFDAQGNPIWIKNPGILETQDASGNTLPMHASPPLPGSPPGTPGEATPILGPGGVQVITKIAPQQQEGRNEVVKEFLGKDQDAYISAQNTQAWLTQIDHAADVMNQAGGAYQSGPFAPQRLALLGHINDVGRTLGLGSPFSPGAIASAEEMRKATTTAGFELASHYEGHARQAAATIMNATSAVPGMANSPQGLSLVSAGIREGAQAAIDMHEFKQDVYNKTQGAGLESAETDFAKRFPAQMYATRAISTVQPPTLTANSLADFTAKTQQYLPGTRVIVNGQPKIVPARDGAPAIPSYIQQRYMTPAGGGG